MKRMMIVAAAAMITAAGAMGQPSYFSDEARHKCSDLANAEQRYVLCLESDNTGVIESALAHAVNMKLICPSVEFRKLKAEISNLSKNGSTPVTRYKAYLAGLVFENAPMFSRVRQAGYETPEELFRSVATQVQMTLLDEGGHEYAGAR
jgi:hypothetical protein